MISAHNYYYWISEWNARSNDDVLVSDKGTGGVVGTFCGLFED